MFLYEAIYGKTIFFSNASQMFFNTNYMMLHVKVMAHTEQLKSMIQKTFIDEDILNS